MSSGFDGRLIGELLRNPNAARVRFVERGLALAGHPAIRQPHLPIFEYIDRERGSRVSYLAKHANITAQAMGELVDYLTAHGYVERVPDPADGRAKIIRLSGRGREAQALAQGIFADIEREWAERVGRERMDTLREVLEELTALEPASAQPA